VIKEEIFTKDGNITCLSEVDDLTGIIFGIHEKLSMSTSSMSQLDLGTLPLQTFEVNQIYRVIGIRADRSFRLRFSLCRNVGLAGNSWRSADAT